MNGAPTGYAANRPTQNNIRPPRKRTGATCDARMTTAMPRTGQYKTTNRPSPRHICRHPTRPTYCAVPAPGVMNGAPTSYAANRPTQNNIRPPRKRTGATCDARMTDAMPRTGQYKTTNRPSPRHICRCPTRPTDCAVPAPGVMNGAPTGYAANRPPQNNSQSPQT